MSDEATRLLALRAQQPDGSTPDVAPDSGGWLALQSLLGSASPATVPRREAAIRLDL